MSNAQKELDVLIHAAKKLKKQIKKLKKMLRGSDNNEKVV